MVKFMQAGLARILPMSCVMIRSRRTPSVRVLFECDCRSGSDAAHVQPSVRYCPPPPVAAWLHGMAARRSWWRRHWLEGALCAAYEHMRARSRPCIQGYARMRT
jgi:hypothetical protein